MGLILWLIGEDKWLTLGFHLIKRIFLLPFLRVWVPVRNLTTKWHQGPAYRSEKSGCPNSADVSEQKQQLDHCEFRCCVDSFNFAKWCNMELIGNGFPGLLWRKSCKPAEYVLWICEVAIESGCKIAARERTADWGLQVQAGFVMHAVPVAGYCSNQSFRCQIWPLSGPLSTVHCPNQLQI